MIRPGLSALLDQLRDILFGDLDSPRIVPCIGPFAEQSDLSDRKSNRGVVSGKKGPIMAVVKLGSSQQVRVSAKFVDRRGNPAPVQDPLWMTDKSDVLDVETLESLPEEPACLVKALGPLGTATLTLSADADPGDGLVPILGTLEFQVTVGNAVRVELQPDVPEEQPETDDTGVVPVETDDILGSDEEDTADL